MLERSELYLKLLCAALAVLVVFQLARVVAAKNPLKEINVAFLSSSTNAASAAPTTPATKMTNTPPTNAAPANATNAASTNLPPGIVPARGSGLRPPTARGPGGRSGGAPDLPPAVNTRVEKIKDSEIFGAVPRPPPMALLGIAGKDVLLRTASGQTDWVREGKELGGVKILQIGTNRVLVEVEGQKQELMIFSGFGSESLMSKGKETK